MERFPQDLLLREMCTAEASFHSELRSVSLRQVLRRRVELVDLACRCSANFLGRFAEPNLITAGPVRLNDANPGAGFNPRRSPAAPLGSGVNAPWQIGVYAPYHQNGFSA